MTARRTRRSRPALAVLCSGQGTNLQAILNAAQAGRIPARVAIVVSDRAKAPALRRAVRAGVEACYINPKQYPSRARFEQALMKRLEAHHVRLICLAGFMRILTPVFVRRYPQRIVNVHPALLPAFPGACAIRDALAWGAKVTGVTVHFVDEKVDHGPIILQEAVAIRPGETASRLLARVHRLEHRLYPKAIRLVLGGTLRVVERTVRFRERLAKHGQASFG